MRIVILLLAAVLGAYPAAAQQPSAPPHAWLFGAWTGGLFPPPVTLSAQECLAQPTVIFTRDVVMRATVMEPTYLQRLVETVRATNTGFEFRLVRAPSVAAASGPFGIGSAGGPNEPGFGCADPDGLTVVRRSANEITFPNCPELPYPLIRCPGG